MTVLEEAEFKNEATSELNRFNFPLWTICLSKSINLEKFNFVVVPFWGIITKIA